MEYAILEGDAEGLRDLVNAHIQNGWRPQGGVALIRFERPYGRDNETVVEWWYAQAMVREESERRRASRPEAIGASIRDDLEPLDDVIPLGPDARRPA